MVAGPRLLVVCTANQCRSPLAEFLLRDAVRDSGIDWQINSAGTHAVPGLPMHQNTERLLTSRGFVVDGWHTTQIDDSLLDAADLVLTATRQHTSYLVGSRPQLRGKIFPLRRLGRIADEARRIGVWLEPPADLAGLFDVVRRVPLPVDEAIDDLADPVGQPYRRFKICAREIDDAITQLIRA